MENDLLAGTVGVGDQDLVVAFVWNDPPIRHALAVGRKCDRAGYVTDDLPRCPTQRRDRINIEAVRIRGVLVHVIQVIAIGRESCARAEESTLRRHYCDFTAGNDLFDAQTALALAASVDDHFAIRRHCGKTDRLTMIGELPDVDVAGINCRRVLADEFVDAEGSGDDKHQDPNRRPDHYTFVSLRFGHQHRARRGRASARGISRCGYVCRSGSERGRRSCS